MEGFRALYTAPDRATAETTLTAWETQVRTAAVPEFQRLFATGSVLGSWRNEVLNYLDHPYTNGFVEGKNTRTKQLQRQAYGYRHHETLRLRILLPTG